MRHLVGIYVVADALVRGELHLVVLGVETGGWQDLIVLTFAGSGARPPVTLCGEGVEVLAGDLPLLGCAFGALTLVDEIMLLQEILIHREARLAVSGVAEHRRPRHALRARGDGVAYVPRGHCLRGEMGSLLAGATHAVEAYRGHRHGETGEHHAESPEVRPLLAGLGDGAVYDVLDFFGVQSRPLQQPVEGARQKSVGTYLAEGPAGFSERGAHGLEDYGLSHRRHDLSSPMVRYSRKPGTSTGRRRPGSLLLSRKTPPGMPGRATRRPCPPGCRSGAWAPAGRSTLPGPRGWPPSCATGRAQARSR